MLGCSNVTLLETHRFTILTRAWQCFFPSRWWKWGELTVWPLRTIHVLSFLWLCFFETEEMRNKEEKETIKRGSFTQLPLSRWSDVWSHLGSSSTCAWIDLRIDRSWIPTISYLTGMQLTALFREVFSESWSSSKVLRVSLAHKLSAYGNSWE